MKSTLADLDYLLQNKLNLEDVANNVGDSKHFSLFSKDDSSLKNILAYIDEQMFENEFEKACIISIIGKSALNVIHSKANPICNLVGQNVFTMEKTLLYKDSFVQIDGYYDINNRIIFLHLSSAFDSSSLADMCKELEKKFIEMGYLSQWPTIITEMFKGLVLIFSLSHIVIVASPTPRFDISCVNMFRIVNSQREKLQSMVSEMLQPFSGLPSSWAKSGRLCVPQLLFTFEANEGFEYINGENVQEYSKQLEEQIHRVLRKSRLISTVTSDSLFTISSSSPFVFISTTRRPIIDDYSLYFFQTMSDRCNSLDTGQLSPSTTTTDSNQPFLSFLLPHFNSVLYKSFDEAGGSSTGSNSRPQSSGGLAKASNFFRLLLAFKELIFSQTYTGISATRAKDVQQIFESLHSTLDFDNRFSDQRCSRMVNNAFAFYKENLPSHYTRETHERKLMLTLQHYTVLARGPALYKYIKVIQADCDNYWASGRKKCEVISLTGNYCVHKVHRAPQDDYSGDPEPVDLPPNTPVLAHNSMSKIISACDCGRRQGNREDPFTVKAANYDFYLKMKFKCHTCRNIRRIKFRVCETSSEFEKLSSSQNLTSKSETRHTDSPVAVRTFSDTEEASLSDESHKHEDDEDAEEEMHRDSGDNLGQLISLNNEDHHYVEISDQIEDNDGEKNNSSAENDGSEKEVSPHSPFEEKSESFEDKSSQLSENEEFDEKQFLSEEECFAESTTEVGKTSGSVVDLESLPPMIHTLIAEDTPARFSSWSLVCLGPSSIYSHNIGIQDQQGFINGSHFLLPWNVTVMLQHSRNMPPLWEGKRPPGIKHKKTLKDGTQFTVKIFIGVEYECPRGHRFISSAPDQILHTTSNVFKETAMKIATSDVPIYMHCICSRPDKSPVVVAQLMRIHIVTPKAPINVTLNPFVQMTPKSNSPLFHPGHKEPIRLSQSNYWVLRLPMIYELDGQRFPYPKEPPPYCRLLKNCYGVADQQKL